MIIPACFVKSSKFINLIPRLGASTRLSHSVIVPKAEGISPLRAEGIPSLKAEGMSDSGDSDESPYSEGESEVSGGHDDPRAVLNIYQLFWVEVCTTEAREGQIG